jgi:hypothetical protein
MMSVAKRVVVYYRGKYGDFEQTARRFTGVGFAIAYSGKSHTLTNVNGKSLLATG